MTKEQRIVEALRRAGDDPMTTDEICNAIGGSKDSAHAALSRAYRAGLIVRVRTGHYVAAKVKA